MYLLHKCQSTLESISSEWSFCIGTAVGAIFAPAAFLICLLMPFRRSVWLAAGTMAVLLVRFLPLCWQEPSFERFMNGRAATVNFLLKVDDPRLSTLPALDPPRGIRAELKEIHFAGGNEKHLCRGRVIVYSNMPLPRRSGVLLAGRGVLDPPGSEAWRKEWRLRTSCWEVCGFEKSWRTYSLQIRDKLLIALTSSIKDDTNRNLAAAFYLGATGGMNSERRRDFAAAGTIHLFAVSGLHVGMAALLILLMLRFCPFRWRMFTAAAGVWCYVFLSGAAVPALRAGVMISAFLICRGMLLATPSLRLMGIAAGVIIICDPGALSSIGFHFSFLITAALLLLSERLQTLRQLESRLFTIMPFSPYTLGEMRRFNRGFALKAMLFSGVAALLAGSVVSLYHTLAIAPGAVIANLFTMPLLTLLFAMLPVKLLSYLAGTFSDRMAAQIISSFFDYLRAVAEIMSELCTPFYAFAPGVLFAALAALLLLGALKFRRKLLALGAGAAFLAMLGSLLLLSWCESSKVTVISSGCDAPPTVVVCDKGIGRIAVVNPVWKHNTALEKVLKRAGASRIHEIAFSRPSVKNLSGLNTLAKRYPVEMVVMPPMTGRNWKFSDRITEGRGEFFCVKEGLGAENLKLFREKNKFAIEYPDSGVILGWRLEISDSDEGRVVEFTRGGTKRRATLPWSNKNGVWQHEL